MPDRVADAGHRSISERVHAAVEARDRGRYEEAVVGLRDALRALPVNADGALLGWISNELGVACKYAGHYAEGRLHLALALALLSAAHGDPSPELASVCHNIGGILHAEGRHEEAVRWARRSIRVRRASGGSRFELDADNGALASILCDLDQLDEAEEILTDVLARHTAALGPSHLEVGVTLSNLGAVAARRGDLVGAVAHLEQALRIKTDTLGPDHPSTVLSRRNLDWCRTRHHRTKETALHQGRSQWQ